MGDKIDDGLLSEMREGRESKRWMGLDALRCLGDVVGQQRAEKGKEMRDVRKSGRTGGL